MLVLPPMPRASVRMAVAENPGFLVNSLAPTRTSCRRTSHCSRRSPGEVPEGSKPEAECLGPAPARPHVFLFVGERLFHVAAEFSAELERQEAEQRAIGAPGV
jgi:hypothetical protein